MIDTLRRAACQVRAFLAGVAPVVPDREPEHAEIAAGEEHEEGKESDDNYLAHGSEHGRTLAMQQLVRELVHGERGRAEGRRSEHDGEGAVATNVGHHRSCAKAET